MSQTVLPPETLAAYAVTASTITAIVLAEVKVLVINPRMKDGDSKTALIQSISYLLNFALILTAVSVQGAFDPSEFLLYILLALGQTLGSHVTYTQVSK